MRKLFALFALSQELYSKWLLKRLVITAIMLAGLVIVISIMIGALLIVSLYAAYGELLQSGLPVQTSMFAVMGLILVVIIVLILIAMQCARNMRYLPHKAFERKSSFGGHIGEVFNGFISGLMKEHK